MPEVANEAAALTDDSKERTDEAVAVLLGVSEELDGGDAGEVVLNGISRLCRVLLSAFTVEDCFTRPVSSASLI